MPVRFSGGGGGGAPAGPTFIVTDNIGVKDQPGLAFAQTDTVGFRDEIQAWVLAPTDLIGWKDAMDLTGEFVSTDRVGGKDSVLFSATATMLAQKDSWCDVIALCPVDNNRDATDLQMDSIVATRKDIMIGWDLSGFPTGATVTAATLTMGLKTAPTASAQLNGNLIAEANEGWSEATVKCSNIPADSGTFAVGFAAVGTGAGPRDVSGAFSAAGLTRIAARMGVGTFSIRCIGQSPLTNCVFESADEGTDNSLGPRLEITFTKAV